MKYQEEYDHYVENFEDITYQEWLELEIDHLRRALKTKDKVIERLIGEPL